MTCRISRFHIFKFEKCIYFVIYLYVFKLVFSLNIFYLPIKQTKWIRHKLNKKKYIKGMHYYM